MRSRSTLFGLYLFLALAYFFLRRACVVPRATSKGQLEVPDLSNIFLTPSLQHLFRDVEAGLQLSISIEKGRQERAVAKVPHIGTKLG